MRRFLSFLFLVPATVLVAACTTNVPPPGNTSGNTASMPAADSMASADAMSPDESDARVMEMNVANWSFTPSAITAKKGEKLIVRLHGVEGKHSFALRDFNINVPIEPGETKDIEIPTDKAGTFEFRCLVPCGPGHREMKGTLVIE